MSSQLEVVASAALYAATEADVGIVVQTNDVRRAKAILYRFRQEVGDPILKTIQVRISPVNPEHELWLIRMQEVQDDA